MGHDEYTLLPLEGAGARREHQAHLGRRKLKQALILLTSLTAAMLLWASLATSPLLPAATSYHGPFALIPPLSALPPEQHRLTAYTTWNGDSYRDYLRHFVYSAQLNADSLDVVLINLRNETSGKCLRLADHGVDATWGGNFHHLCLDAREWKRRHLDFFCHEEHGWACTKRQRAKVAATLEVRLAKNKKNAYFRPFLPYLVADMVPAFASPFWAWMDMDMHLGRLSHLPFNVLSRTSFVTTSLGPYQFLRGQMTLLNLGDESLKTAWRRGADFQTPEAFFSSRTVLNEEKYWSREYLNSDDPSHAGWDLSWAALPEYGTGDSETRHGKNILVSGRDVLLVDSSLSRLGMEGALEWARSRPVDDLGGLDWDPSTVGSCEAMDAEAAPFHCFDQVRFARGSVCNPRYWLPPQFAQCLPKHALEKTKPRIARGSYLRLRDSPPGLIHRRVERDMAIRAYSPKPFGHYLYIKKYLTMPEFDIDEQHAMVISLDRIDVFRLGATREETIFHSNGTRPG